MLNRIRSFGEGVAAIAKAHPVLTIVSVLLLPLVVGGLTWKLVSLIRRAPGGNAVASAAATVAKATGSA